MIDTCPTCGMLPGACRHTSELEVTVPTRPQRADASTPSTDPPVNASPSGSAFPASSPAGAADESADSLPPPDRLADTLPPKRIATHFKRRRVTVDRAVGINALAVTIGVADSQFTILAPTMEELQVAWTVMERGNGVRYPAMDMCRVQKVCIVDQAQAKDVAP